MSAPIRYSGTAAAVVVIAAATASASATASVTASATPVSLSPVRKDDTSRQSSTASVLEEEHHRGNNNNNFQLLKNSLEKIAGKQQQQQGEEEEGEQQQQQTQQQQELQRQLEEVLPHQLKMSTSVDEPVVVTPPIKSMEVVVTPMEEVEEVQLEGGSTSQFAGSKLQTTVETEWRGTSDDEGGFGTPGAAGLDYQNYQLQQQQQQQQQTSSACEKKIISNNGQVEEEAANGGGETTDNYRMDQSSSTDNNTQSPSSSSQAMEEELMEPGIDSRNPTIFNNNINGNMEQEIKAMTTEKLYHTLKEYNALQDKYHTVLLLPKESKREVTAGGRDGSAYVLRCLKIWYELPSDVLFSAMSLVDRFLDRMTVKPKHMACMSVASFHIAIRQLQLKAIPAEDLVTISQCGCTAGDLERMSNVIGNKLGVQMGHVPITSVNYLRIYYALFYHLAKEIGGQFYVFYQQLIKLEELENRLEILLCDVKTTVITPSTLAMVLICLHLDFHIKESYTRGSPELKHVFEYILFLQQYMGIPDRVFTCGFSIVSDILSHYNGQNKQPYKQRLVWKLSSRTLRVLRPMNRFYSDLPTIQEGISNAIDEGCRSRTESISSEEEEDWPTSPIIPIFEQC